MHIVLLDWVKGENNPFVYFNDHLGERLQEHGCIVSRVNADEELGERILNLNLERKVHLVLTHQGIATDARLSDGNLFWDTYKIKIISLHSDHPCHAPKNHEADSPYVSHTYCLPPFTLYSNRHFTRNKPAIFLGLPSFFQYIHTDIERQGNYFVFPKNLDSIDHFHSEWKKFPNPLTKFLVDSSEIIKENYILGDPLEHHDIIDTVLTEDNLEKLTNLFKDIDKKTTFHFIHSQLDKFYRNVASELVIQELIDIPLHINGRGWEKHAQNKSRNHVYNETGEIQLGDRQFYSNYGIIDVVPHRHSLHDRTMRAIAHSSGFLSNSRLYFTDSNGVHFNKIFYSGQLGDLLNKAENVIKNPKEHREYCSYFGRTQANGEPFINFYRYLTQVCN